jgi:hypothetical protein
MLDSRDCSGDHIGKSLNRRSHAAAFAYPATEVGPFPAKWGTPRLGRTGLSRQIAHHIVFQAKGSRRRIAEGSDSQLKHDGTNLAVHDIGEERGRSIATTTERCYACLLTGAGSEPSDRRVGVNGCTD